MEGLLHISELADHKIESPEEVVKVGDELEIKILRVDAADRKIGLSRKRLNEPGVPDVDEIPTGEGEETAGTPAKPKDRELRGGTGGAREQLITMPEEEKKE